MNNYRWECTCGRRGKPLSFNKAANASHRHLLEHERALDWDSVQDLVKQ